jgi:fructokinase
MTRSGVDVAGTGFTVLDRVYQDDVMAFEALGGSCGNVLVSLAMLDRVVVPVIALGDDDVGQSLIGEFERAGADTSYISCSEERASPVLAQKLDTGSGAHWFSFTCPETSKELPKYASIDHDHVRMAATVFESCLVFYADRVSAPIVEAMERASRAGAIVYFEPSSIDDQDLFERAVTCSHILKYSSDRLATCLEATALKEGTILVVTHGVDGLELRQGEQSRWSAAIPAAKVMDTCGSGDMVSVGIIDWIVGRGRVTQSLAIDDLLEGVVAGQRLAAANCAYAGARGLFAKCGAVSARRLLSADREMLAPVAAFPNA